MREYEYHLLEEARAGRLSRRELLRRASVAGLSAVAVSTLLAACGGEDGGAGAGASAGTATGGAAGQPKLGGTARLATQTPAADVDPVTLGALGAQQTAAIPLEYLCSPSPDYKLQPALATRWSSNDDGTEWTFAIRDGVRWHDGSPMTVDDVVGTFKRLTDPKVASAALQSFEGILPNDGIEKGTDERSVVFRLDRAFVDFPYLVSAFNYNAFVLPTNYQIGDFIKGGVGTGPYILKSYTPKQQATYVRNPDYWQKGKPYLDGITLKFFAGTQQSALALQGGSIDAVPYTAVQGAQAIFSDPDITILENPSNGYVGVHMRVDREPFTDRRVRQAIALCIDRDEAIKSLLAGKADLGNDHMWAKQFDTSPTDIPQRQQDYEQARALLADAGHGDGLTVTHTAPRVAEEPQFAVMIQQACKPAGITVKLDLMEETAYYGSGDNTPWLEVDFGQVIWLARGIPSQSIIPAYLSTGIWNAAHWKNAKFDSLVRRFDAELDLQRRRAIAREAATIQHDEVPEIIAYFYRDLRAAGRNLHGLPQGPAAYLATADLWLG